MKTALTLAVAVASAAAAVRAQEPQRRQVVAGAQYAASGFHQLFFGADYRALWTTPVTVEVLDLQREAGGLSPVRRVGGQQTKGLALKGRDGRNYTFRGVEKDASELLEQELRGTVVERTLQDQMAAQHPASEPVASVILDAAGIPYPSWRLVVLPDDAALGEFRKDFAGAVGVFAEYPSAAGDGNPGFRGITEIVDHLTLYKKLEQGPEDLVDAQALLRARLADIFMGDWDRHRKQWRWARVPGNPRWVPIPEDRDQSFSRYEGLVLERVRGRDARFQVLTPRYPDLGGLTFNGWEQDRRLLVGLGREDFQRAAEELRGRITDQVIERAAAAMPAEWAALDGPRLVRDLKARRDALPQAAEAYYRHLAGRVDVYMTDRPERVEARRTGGDLEVTVAAVGADGRPQAPYFQRVFRGADTEEVRFYTLGGDDAVAVTGSGPGPRVRAVGGAGNDRLSADGGGARLWDHSGSNRAEGASLDDRPYTAPPGPKNAPWIPPRDWGAESWMLPWLGFNGDTGLFLGMGVERRGFGFRKHPYASRQVLRAGYALGEKSGKVDYRGEFHRENSSTSWGLRAYASGLEVMRFHGFGNETVSAGDEEFYRAEANQLLLYPSLDFHVGRGTTLSLGPAVKFTRTEPDELRFINLSRPYGVGDFGEVALHGALTFDGRDSAAFTRRGLMASVRGTVFPGVWDVRETFGEVNGDINLYASAGERLTLAVRAGGKRVFGEYPYLEAAVIGGGTLGTGALDEPDYTLRGFRTRRFSGDASLYGNADLRLRLSRVTLVLPGDWGLLGFADTGRVWLEGEDGRTWHTGVGGGLWMSFLNNRSTISMGIAHSEEDDLFYFKGGFTF